MFRFFYIAGIVIQYAGIYLLYKLGFYKKNPEKLLRKFFEDAGGSFVKLGQILALRVDVLPKEYSIELLDLFDNVKPFAYGDVERIFIEELGAKPEKIFKDFQKVPFASASFGQVHAAKLEDSTIVAVKVLRPGIEIDIVSDFMIVDFCVLIADTFFKSTILSWKEMGQEFKEWTRKELDYRIEAQNAELMYQSLKDNKNVVIPKVYHNLTTQKILVEEYIEGILLSKVLRGLKDGRLNAEKLLSYGFDIKKAPRIMTEATLEQYFKHKIMHADLHPGNVILLPNDRIALIDFGIIGKEIPINQLSLLRCVKYSADMDFEQSTYYAMSFAVEDLKQTIKSAFPATVSQKRIDEFIEVLSVHFSSTVQKIVLSSTEDLKLMKKDYFVMLLQILRVSEKYRVKMPKEFVLLARTLGIGGFLAKELDNTFRLQLEIQKFFKKYPEDELVDKNNPTYVPFKRINRERALEQLNNWLSYLAEIDPPLYQLVKEKIAEYNFVEK